MDLHAVKERLERLQAKIAPHEENWDHIASSPATAASAANLQSALRSIATALDNIKVVDPASLADTSSITAASGSIHGIDSCTVGSSNGLSSHGSNCELSSSASTNSSSTTVGSSKGSIDPFVSSSTTPSPSNDEAVAAPAALNQHVSELLSAAALPASPTSPRDFSAASSDADGGVRAEVEDSSSEWECERCTFINASSKVSCALCATRRPKPRHSLKPKKVESSKEKVPSKKAKGSSKRSESGIAPLKQATKSKKRKPSLKDSYVQQQLDMIETCIECGKSTSNPGEEYTVLRCGRRKKCIRETHLHCSGHDTIPRGYWLCGFCSRYFYLTSNKETLEKIASKKGLNVEVLLALNKDRFPGTLRAKDELQKNTDILLQAPPPKSLLNGVDFETGYPEDETATALEEAPKALKRVVAKEGAKKRSRYIDSSGSEEESADDDIDNRISSGVNMGDVSTSRLEAPAVGSTSSPSSPDVLAPIVRPLPVPRWGPKPWGTSQWSGEAQQEIVARCRAGNASGVASLLAEAADITCHGARGVDSTITWLSEAADATKPEFSGLSLVHHALLCADSNKRPATLAVLLSFSDKHLNEEQRAAVLTLPTRPVVEPISSVVASGGGSVTMAAAITALPVGNSTPLHLCAAASDEVCARMIIAAALRWGLLSLASYRNVDHRATPARDTDSAATLKEGISALGGRDSLGQTPCAVALKHHGNVNLVLHLAGLKLCKGTYRTWNQFYLDLLVPLDCEGNDACALLAVAIANSSNMRIGAATPVAAMAKMVRAIEMAQPDGDESATAASTTLDGGGGFETSEDPRDMAHQSLRLKLVHSLQEALVAVATNGRNNSDLTISEWNAAASVWRVLLPRLPLGSSTQQEEDDIPNAELREEECRQETDLQMRLRKLSDPIHVAIAARDFELLGLAITHRDRLARTVATVPSHLHIAVIYGWVEGAALLLSRGCADPNATDADGCTPLMRAIDSARGRGPSSAQTPSDSSLSIELGTRESTITSTGSSNKRKCCEDNEQPSTLLPAMPHSMVALFLQQDSLDLAAADKCGRTVMHRLFAPCGCPDYSSGNVEIQVSEEVRAELLGIMLGSSSSSGLKALEVALTQRCNGTAAGATLSNMAEEDVSGTVGYTAAELLRMPPDGCSISPDDESVGCVRWQEVDELLEEFETLECIALSAQTERPSKESLREALVEILPRERFGISATPFPWSLAWGGNAESEVSTESLGGHPQPQGSLRVTTTLATVARESPAKKKQKKVKDSQLTNSVSTSATSTTSTSTKAPLPTLRHDFVYLATSVPSPEVEGVSIEDYANAARVASSDFASNVSIGKKDFVPESGSLLQRFGSATVEGLAAIIYSKVAPKKAESRAGAFKMVPASTALMQARERQKAQEDAEENELLFESRLYKVDAALWHLADNSNESCDNNQRSSSSSGTNRCASSSSSSSSNCSSNYSSSSESTTSKASSGLCVRVRCLGQLIRRAAIRFREANAFMGEKFTEDGQLMWNALEPGGLAKIHRAGGSMKPFNALSYASSISISSISSSSSSSSESHVPAREWVFLLQEVLEWPADSKSTNKRYSEASAASAIVKLLLGLDERMNAKMEAFSDGWARDPVLSTRSSSSSSSLNSGYANHTLWSERECWAGGLRSLLDSPANPSENDGTSNGTTRLPLTLAAVEPFLVLFLERCPSPRTHDHNWKRHQSHALYEQTKEGLWKATKLRKKVAECSWCSDCSPDACQCNLLQRGPRFAQPPLEVFYCNPDKGFGVRSPVNLPQHAFICEYVGEIFDSKKDGGARDYRYAKEERMQYILPLGDSTASVAIDATLMGNVARFLNHSCAPNIYKVEVFGDRADKLNFRVAFFTSRAVEAGEELTWSYGKTYGSRKTDKKCHCGALGCNGKMP